jgi:hypothetical protein
MCRKATPKERSSSRSSHQTPAAIAVGVQSLPSQSSSAPGAANKPKAAEGRYIGSIGRLALDGGHHLGRLLAVMAKRSTLRPGQQPYDPLNGLRVGGLAGGILGGIATAVTSVGNVWLVVVGVVLGGAIGYLYERRKM